MSLYKNPAKDERGYWKMALEKLPEISKDPNYMLNAGDRVFIILDPKNRTVNLIKKGVKKRVSILMRRTGKDEIEFITNK